MRHVLAVAIALFVTLSLSARQNEPEREEKGTYLGVLVSAAPEVLYDQLPDLPPGYGVVVSHVLPNSPAATAGIRRHDILLQYDDEKLRDGEHLARLIRGSKPDQKVKLHLLRAGKKQTAEVTLSLGPVLKIASNTTKTAPEEPRGTAKPGTPPPSVQVAVTPLDGGKMKVTIEYYKDAAGRTETVTCDGTPDEIATKVKKLELPQQVRDLADVAFQRIRELEFTKRAAEPRPTANPRNRQSQ